MFIRRSCLILALPALLVGTGHAGMKSDSQVKAAIEASKPDAEGKQVITITLDVNKGWYIYANPIDNKDFLPNQTNLRVLAGKKEVEAKFDFPPGVTKTVGKESYKVWKDKITIKAHVVRPADVKEMEIHVRLSSCSEAEMICLIPATVRLKVP